jgi:hypothetical protein
MDRNGRNVMPRTVLAMRCYAEECAEGWQAHCVELDLTACGPSLDDTRAALERQIHVTLDAREHGEDGSPVSTAGRNRHLVRYCALRLAADLGLRRDMLHEHGQAPAARHRVR